MVRAEVSINHQIITLFYLPSFCEVLTMRKTAILLLICLGWAAAWHAAQAGDPAKTIRLFNGKDLTGWRIQGDPAKSQWKIGTAALDPADPTKLVVTPGGNELINAGAHGVNIFTEAKSGDARIELEVMVPRHSNSGVFAMGVYEIQVLDSYGRQPPGKGDMGALYGKVAPKLNASKKPGQWQKMVIDYRAPKFDAQGKKTADARMVKVTLNGEVIHEDAQLDGITAPVLYDHESPTGPILLQGDHGQVAYRNIEITKLD
jgi:hypothetical protein